MRKTVLSRKTPGAKAPAQPTPSPVVLPSPAPEKKAEAKAKPKRKPRAPRPLLAPVPPILLEGDHPAPQPTPQGRGKRFIAQATPPPPAIAPERAEVPPPSPTGAPAELPESYGTKRVFLAARDPYCLFVSWDLPPAEARRFGAASPTGTLVIRLHRDFAQGEVALEVHVEPELRDRFVNIPNGGRTFAAELGYYERDSGHWKHISVSKPATAPPEAGASDPTVINPPLPEMFAIFPEPVRVAARPVAVAEPEPPKPAIPKEEPIWASPAASPAWADQQPPRPVEAFQPRFEPRVESPQRAPQAPRAPLLAPELEVVWHVREWTPAQAAALQEIISREMRYWQEGSIELSELIETHLGHAPTSPTHGETIMRRVARALRLAGPEEIGLSSEAAIPQPEAPGKKPFWMRVNAELVVYGATEPDARVTIGGRAIKLRPDGTFSYRFALPDGDYRLPITGVSRDGEHSREADLRFSRASIYRGEVKAEQGDPGLRKAAPENVE